MNDTKKWYESTGIIGPIVAGLSFLNLQFGWNVVTSEEANMFLHGIFEMGGIIMGAIGRWKASSKIV